jgi:para-aminobenzoate synthetase component I
MYQYPLKMTIDGLPALAKKLACYQDFVWLDSASSSSAENSISILAFESSKTKSFRLGEGEAFDAFLNEAKEKPCSDSSLRFSGGWIGYIAYEAYSFNKQTPFKATHQKDYPLAVFRYYDKFVYVDHGTGEISFVNKDGDKEWIAASADGLLAMTETNSKTQTPQITHKTPKEKYSHDLSQIKSSLENGDYLELNYTQEFSCPFTKDPIDLYLHLRSISPAPMMAYLGFPEIKVLSASPERFFRIEDQKITTYPIKGTIKRGQGKDDEELKKELIASSKDQAELLMVTDMLRNDLGRVCELGSVQVNEVSKVHTFSHYHHLIAEITGRLKKALNLSDVFSALFPGGSITGAPKVKAIQEIDALENRARGIYTGALGFISNNGVVDFNIPIRTLTCKNNQLEFSTGGGIVVDSDIEKEYEECMIKAAGIFEAINAVG